MDDELQRLRRSVRESPDDLGAALALASALANAGALEEWLAVLDARSEPEADELLVKLACDPDVEAPLRDHAQKAVKSALPKHANRFLEVLPWTLARFVERGTSLPAEHAQWTGVERDLRDHWTEVVAEVVRGTDAGSARVLLPWLLPLLRASNGELRRGLRTWLTDMVAKGEQPFAPLALLIERALREAAD